MKTISITLISALLFGINILYGQKQDVIYLKNGSVIRGALLDTNITHRANILSAGNQWVYSISKVDSITKENALPKPDKIFTAKKTGHYNHWTLSPMHGTDRWGSGIKSFAFHITQGYQFNERWAAGAGIGLDAFEGAYYPFYGQGVFSFVKGNFTPYIGTQVGYVIPASNDIVLDDVKSKYGGIMFEAEFGIKKYYRNNFGITASVGYRYQETKSKYLNWREQSISTVYNYYNRLSLRVGMLFR
ncbi:MAG: hypothetical protein HRT72_01760 [Flavobacteriales bacterium]|nr:hypothetical protein [Flavobacteriales bacterium]